MAQIVNASAALRVRNAQNNAACIISGVIFNTYLQERRFFCRGASRHNML